MLDWSNDIRALIQWGGVVSHRELGLLCRKDLIIYARGSHTQFLYFFTFNILKHLKIIESIDFFGCLTWKEGKKNVKRTKSLLPFPFASCNGCKWTIFISRTHGFFIFFFGSFSW